jgi:hypothetical protein
MGRDITEIPALLLEDEEKIPTPAERLAGSLNVEPSSHNKWCNYIEINGLTLYI